MDVSTWRREAGRRFGSQSVLAFYTSRRLHQALVHRTPMAVGREGVTGALGVQAMDMTLRFDNAVALAGPQPQQQQQTALIAA
jgi:hypothetical protein